MFVTLMLGLATARLARRVLPPMLPAIIDDLAITPFAAGVALSVASVCFALLQYPGGRIADHLTRKTALVTGLVVLVVGAAILLWSPILVVFIIGAAVVGAGEGLYGAADRVLLSDLFREKRGLAFGVHSMASDLGNIAAAGLAVAVLAVATWRAAFLVPLLLVGLIVVLLIRWGREAIVVAGFPFHVRETTGRLVRNRRLRRVVVAYTLFAFTVQGFTGFLPAFLQAEHGFSTALASAGFALLYVVGAVAKPAAGRISDRVSRPYVGGGGLVLGALGVVVLVVAPSAPVAIAGVVIFAAGHKAFPPVMQAYLMDVFPDDSRGGDLGATRTTYIGLGAVGPAYVGFVAGRLDYVAAFAGFIVVLLVAGALMLRLSMTDGS